VRSNRRLQPHLQTSDLPSLPITSAAAPRRRRTAGDCKTAETHSLRPGVARDMSPPDLEPPVAVVTVLASQLQQRVLVVGDINGCLGELQAVSRQGQLRGWPNVCCSCW
jgi:hypothetical protein